MYLRRLPKDLEAGPVILVDPMLATAGPRPPARPHPPRGRCRRPSHDLPGGRAEGIERMRRDHPELTIYTAAIDRALDPRGFIVPGLGDAGDRMYGTE